MVGRLIVASPSQMMTTAPQRGKVSHVTHCEFCGPQTSLELESSSVNLVVTSYSLMGMASVSWPFF